MGKLVRNAAVSPSEDKFKRIKLTNSKVKSTIVEVHGGVPSLLAMGWVVDPADNEFLMLPKGSQMTMKEVCMLSLSAVITTEVASDSIWMEYYACNM